MPIQFNPVPGSLLQCDFTLHANPQDPEIGKARPVIVVSRPSNGLCIVVPLSTKRPGVLRPWHIEMDHSPWPANLRNQCWAKCDFLLTVAHWRLDRYFRKDQYGKRKYLPFAATAADFEAIKSGILAALGGLA
jgi:mRNA interferase MazF